MSIEKVLLLDEDPHMRTFIGEHLRQRKSEVLCAQNVSSAKELLEKHPFELIISDSRLFQDIATQAKGQYPVPVIILSIAAFDQAAQAMRLGAFNTLLKPINADTLDTLLEKVEEHLDLLRENSYLREEISTHPHYKKHHLIAESEPMKKILSDVEKIAKSSSSVFISGESGTGKEMIAQAIHSQSPRSLQPFIKVNCAAIPTTLLESEFFGHEKGAFTGAINKKLGRFELAHKGTLLLDEISEIPLELQAKLLRAVQEMEFERVGGIRPIRVDVRFISTSNRSMKETVEQKQFREDLYYRLNVVPIHLPPLRERKDDILPLAEIFLKRLCEENQKPLKRLSSESRQKLLHYPWPGNIRELANVIERTIVMNPTETIEAHQLYIDLSCSIKEAPTSSSLPANITLAELERRLILETLARENNNRTKTAQILGISIRTLRNKLHQYKSSSLPQK